MPDNGNQEQNSDNTPIYYVGVGASAGGLEALELLFSHMPPDSGMAFVVIQHLSPDYKSLMVELLSKRTAMTVKRAEEGMLVEANTVYLITPKKNLSIFHGKLLLNDPDPSKGINLPIDIFLRSLADDQGEKAIAVILSGTGSDGVRGIRAVKEAGGMVMVQSEESARFDGMPRSAISTGLSDFILPPEEMHLKLVSFTNHPYTTKADLPQVLLSDEDGLTRIFSLLRERTKVDFTFYKPSTLVRRIERRMTVNQTHSLREYVKFMENQSSEVMSLYRDLLIGVTSFFRDREVFDELGDNHLPDLLMSKENQEVRFWVAGCSTGEEAYSLAILSRECMEQSGRRLDLKIFATDLDRDAIVRAGNGIYPESIAADLPPKLLGKYFHRKDGHYRIDRSIREMVVFAQHNLVKDPPFTKIDLLSCRNLLIYLQPVLQHKVFEFINFSLNPNGILLLGTSETTGDAGDYFEPLHQRYKIYRSRGRSRAGVDSPSFSMAETRPWVRSHSGGSAHMRMHEEERVLDRFLQSLAGDYVPLAVVVNVQMEVLHILGDPDGYLKLPSGKLMNDITKMAPKDLAIPLATGLQKVFKSGTEVKYTNVRMHRKDESSMMQLRIRLLPSQKGQEPLAAVFLQEVSRLPREPGLPETQVCDLSMEAEQRIHDLEQELQFTQENLQATIEELETSNEELQATNEELLASNEELQSTNEELQSVNEELHTVNAEYQSKIIALTELNNDLDNLLAGTRIGTLFLDENLEIRKFTPDIERVFKIRESDVGRPIHHLSHLLDDVEPIEVIKDVERNSVGREIEVRAIDGSRLLMRVLPYRVGASSVAGIVLTFIDIEPLKRVQEALMSSQTQLASLFRVAPVGIGLVIDRIFREVNEQVCRMVGYTREELIGQSTRILYPSEQEFDCVGRMKYDKLSDEGVGAVEICWKHKDGSLIPVLLSTAPLDVSDLSEGVTFTALDLSVRKRAEEQMRINEVRLQSLYEIVRFPAEDIQALLDLTLDEALKLTGSKVGYIYHYDEETKLFTLNSWSRNVMNECAVLEKQTTYDLEKTGLWGEAVRRREPVLVNDFKVADPAMKGYPEGHVELSRFLTVPVISEDRIVAVAGVANKEAPYDEGDVRQLVLLMDSAWKIGRRRVERELIIEGNGPAR